VGQTYKINEFKRVGCPIFLSNSDPTQNTIKKCPIFLSKKFDKIVGHPQTAILQKTHLLKSLIFKRPRKSRYVPLCPGMPRGCPKNLSNYTRHNTQHCIQGGFIDIMGKRANYGSKTWGKRWKGWIRTHGKNPKFSFLPWYSLIKEFLLKVLGVIK